MTDIILYIHYVKKFVIVIVILKFIVTQFGPYIRGKTKRTYTDKQLN